MWIYIQIKSLSTLIMFSGFKKGYIIFCALNYNSDFKNKSTIYMIISKYIRWKQNASNLSREVMGVLKYMETPIY